MREPRGRFPWNVASAFKVESRADGTLLITPTYHHPYKGPEEGGGPGILTRLSLAEWCEGRLKRRRN